MSTKPPPTLPMLVPTPPQSHGPALLPPIEGCEASRTTRGWQIKGGRPTRYIPNRPPSHTTTTDTQPMPQSQLTWTNNISQATTTSPRPPPSPLPATSTTCRQIQHQHHPRSVTAVGSYPLDQDLINRFNKTVNNKSDVYRLPDIKDKSVFWI
ncbi:hypothetical protein BDZ94DRAFT_1323093 [Collybia nuda]|uniref:Uncharacterized protein n=1 Tax=Collybia nuda TaxID=64659 RepID=A0A9P6CII9_9AGAR|nr:hypothetical protein BDZ94DRAFT_1323093 [Collybia nuda]